VLCICVQLVVGLAVGYWPCVVYLCTAGSRSSSPSLAVLCMCLQLVVGLPLRRLVLSLLLYPLHLACTLESHTPPTDILVQPDFMVCLTNNSVKSGAEVAVYCKCDSV